MIEKSWRRLALILFLLAASLVSYSALGVRLGLDLKGGVRLVYRVDVEQAKKDGDVPADKSDAEVMADVILVLERRADPQGVKEVGLTPATGNRILIELPGGDDAEAAAIQARIQDLGQLEMRMVAYDDYRKEGVPIFDLVEEKKRLDDWLGKEGNRAKCELDPVKGINNFNNLPPAEGGPKAQGKLRWVPMYRKEVDKKDGKPVWRYEDQREAHPAGDPTQIKFLPINLDEKHFTGADLVAKALHEAQDKDGQPGVGYQISAARAGDYLEISTKYKDKAKAIILNKEVRLAPYFRGPIPGTGVISGGFTQDEVANLITVLKTGSLQVVPQLESKSTIGATLGESAIQAGMISMAVGTGLVILFMVGYYRISGLISVLGLLVNLALILGAMAFMRATLTLPGFAGLVLTVGMAVDANVLIFERIREERERGKDLVRSIEAGFDRALSAILDSNITTFLTALILYNIGVGPIRGFATTLMIGLVTSVFTAVYVCKLLFHYAVASEKVTDLKMGRFFAAPNYRFLAARHVAMGFSGLVMLGSLALFAVTKDDVKYGLDFMGGGAFRVSLREPTVQQELEKLFNTNALLKDAQVATLNEPGSTGRQSRFFLVKLKLKPEDRNKFEAEQKKAIAERKPYHPPFVETARELLGNRLAYEPFGNVDAIPVSASYSIGSCVLHSSTPIRLADLKKALETKHVQIAQAAGKDDLAVVDAAGIPQPGAEQGTDIRLAIRMDPFELGEEARVKEQLPLVLGDALSELKDAAGKAIVLSAPFPESTFIGSRAVGDLRDAAIAAILLSLLVIVMYIRVRFHEYKYGIAASAALLHDVVVTLGAVILGNRLGLVHAEIDLGMIAAFLTIIGYSLNDTIVTFDRIRENIDIQAKLGGKLTFAELVNKSVNDVLSRTVLTATTVFLSCLSLYLFNRGQGSAIEGFAFAMTVGTVAGTYSTIWIANPIVVWLSARQKPATGQSGDVAAKDRRFSEEEQEQPELA